MLLLKPESGVSPGELLTVFVDVEDEDGDLAGRSAEIGLLREGDSEGELFKVPLSADGDVTKARIALDITLPAGAIPGRYTLGLAVLDAATRRSNALTTPLEIGD